MSVELDKALKPVLGETLAGFENVAIVFADVLKVDMPALLDEKMLGECDRCVRQSAVQRDGACAHHRLSRGGLL
ncbi:MAG: hypothetical protein V8T41_04245 [Oscillospiraceae bacterium]